MEEKTEGPVESEGHARRFKDADGVEFVWDGTKKRWVPLIMSDLVEKHQAMYQNTVETPSGGDGFHSTSLIGEEEEQRRIQEFFSSSNSVPATDILNEDVSTSRPQDNALGDVKKRESAVPVEENTRKRKRKKKPKVKNSGNVVYVSGLPKDTSEEEMEIFFAKYGVIMLDPNTGGPKIILYRNADGGLKGDAIISYMRKEAADNAIFLADGTFFRSGQDFKVKLEIADFKQDSAVIAGKNDHKAVAASKKIQLDRKTKKKIIDSQSDKLSWDISAEKKLSVIVLRPMFKVEKLARNVEAATELREDIMGEAKKFGAVESIKVFENNPEGVVCVKFRRIEDADECKRAFNGRYFDGKRISATFYDGFTDFRVKESEETKKLREEKFKEWLGGDG